MLKFFFGVVLGAVFAPAANGFYMGTKSGFKKAMDR